MFITELGLWSSTPLLKFLGRKHVSGSTQYSDLPLSIDGQRQTRIQSLIFYGYKAVLSYIFSYGVRQLLQLWSEAGYSWRDVGRNTAYDSSNVNNLKRIAAAKGRLRRASMEHTPPQRSMNTNTSKKELPTLLLSETPVAPTTGYALHNKQGLDSHLLPLDFVKIGLKLRNLFLLKSMPSEDNLHKLLHQYSLTSRPLH